MIRPSHAPLDTVTASVRAFNRFYTRQIGALDEGLLQTPFSLTEGRVLYELANREQPAATAVAADLGLDAGYLSRILARFKRLGLISRRPSHLDGRQSLLSLTAKGKAEFTKLNSRSSRGVEEMLEPLSLPERSRLTSAMQTIEHLLRPADLDARSKEPVIFRQPRVGDMGIIVAQQAQLYAREYGWDQRFEALVAKIAAQFIEEFDPVRERCWIAEHGGEVVGSIFLVKSQDEGVAKLRMLYVDPKIRGMGIGNRLVEECLRFARECGYRKVTLWTQSLLLAARRIYERHGFKLVKEWPNRDIGLNLVSEIWDLEL
jgi:DNA-binding MarR family transcriptional regulator/GNAT superfamily N-acetyltransferase